MAAPSLAVASARARMPLLAAGVVLLVVGSATVGWPLEAAGIAAFVAGLACYVRVGLVRREPTTIAIPVAGRWRAFNSPADRVPSHGLLAYGQSHAIDLVHEPVDGSRPELGWWPLARRPADFPGFGQPVHAPADGVVVRAHGWQRDHWSRTSPIALAYLLVESVRELLGPAGVLGNHVVIDCGDGVYAALAHLRHGSLQVRRGQRVVAGQPLGACGNSGNSTEPHLHVQLMDHRRPAFAAGLPMAFEWSGLDGEVRRGLPGKGQTVTASPAPS